MTVANISEIFHSFQGEGLLAGKPFLFIRFGGCNLNCEFCDTADSLKKNKNCTVINGGKKVKISNPVTIDRLSDIVKEYKFSIVSFTGGEPLLYASFIEEALPVFNGKKILIETNGTLIDSITSTLLREVDYWSVDIKLPGISKHDLLTEHKLFLKKIAGGKNIMIKCVFSPSSELEEIKNAYSLALEIHSLNQVTTLTFQPVTIKNKKINMGSNAEYIRDIAEEGLMEIRLIPQMHKILRID
jgi:organic radical activating enzyme